MFFLVAEGVSELLDEKITVVNACSKRRFGKFFRFDGDATKLNRKMKWVREN